MVTGRPLTPARFPRLGDAAIRAASVLTLLLLWEMAARVANRPLFPSPLAVGARMALEWRTGLLGAALAATLARVAAAFVLAMTLGAAIGMVLGLSRTADRFFDAWLTALLNLPALVLIVLLYVWLGLNDLSAVLAVALSKLPATAVTLREGMRALDPDLGELGRAYRFGWWESLRHLLLPQLLPYVMASARSGLALIWKIVLLVELLGRSDGIGFEIESAFQLFDVTRILAYAIAFMMVAQAAEWLILHPLERRAGSWRR